MLAELFKAQNQAVRQWETIPAWVKMLALLAQQKVLLWETTPANARIAARVLLMELQLLLEHAIQLVSRDVVDFAVV